MKRAHFLAAAGTLGVFFGLSMIVSPDAMLNSMTTMTGAGATNVLRLAGVALLTVGVINIMARNDPGSDALSAIMTGNIVLHVVGWGLDIVDWRSGMLKQSGIVMGSIVHGLLLVGFVYYYVKMGKRVTT